MKFKIILAGAVIFLLTAAGIKGFMTLPPAPEPTPKALSAVTKDKTKMDKPQNNAKLTQKTITNFHKTPAIKKTTPSKITASNTTSTQSSSRTTPRKTIYVASRGATVTSSSERVIYGYYAEDWSGDTRSYNSLAGYSRYLNGVATFNFYLTSEGAITGTAPQTALQKATQNNVPRHALLHNFYNGSFNTTAVHKMLSSSSLRSKAVTNIVALTSKYSYNGINIDLEGIPAGDRSRFNQFIKSLADQLHAKGKKITLSVPAKTWDDPQNGWSGAYDYAYLGKVSDGLMLMTYDEHWFGGSPGPVASIGWVRKVASYAVKVIPRSKIYLGVAAYGYDWEVGSGNTEALPYPKAISRAAKYGATIRWHDTYMVPYYVYWKNGKKHEVWFESPDSVGFKFNIIREYGLKGAALWRMGFEDASFWAMVGKKF